MWVRKQEAEAEWQEFATTAAALRHIKAEGAPSTLQQVQIKRVANNSKPCNGFEFSYTPPATANPTVPSRLPSHPGGAAGPGPCMRPPPQPPPPPPRVLKDSGAGSATNKCL